MATEVKRRRGTTTQHDSFTGAEGEITVDLTKDTLVVHDGSTQAGFPLLREDFSNAPAEIDVQNSTIEASEFIGDLRGAVRFKAKAVDTNIAKGDAVYISGIDGNTPTVGLADADNAAKMPAFGLAAADINENATGEIITFGTLSGVDTSSFSVGDILYIDTSPSIGSTLTATAPAGESAQIQNIGKVQRSHATAGSIKVGGAGRSNATPNLDQNKIFLGDSNNRAVSTALSSIGLSSFNDDSTFLKDADFSSNGLMKRTGAGTYGIVTDNSSNWDTAYGWGDHSTVGYLTSYSETDTLSDVTGRGASTTDTVSFDKSSASSGNAFRVLGAAGNIDFSYSGTQISFSAQSTITAGSNDLYLDGGQVVVDTNLYNDGDATVTGSITAGSIVKAGGSSSQFLKADGSVDSNTYLTAVPSEFLTETEGDARYLQLSGGTISQNLIISGNLTVSGTTTTVNTETIKLADNIILLNSNYDGETPTESAGIEIERGPSNTNKQFLWNETNDRWQTDDALHVSGALTATGDLKIAEYIKHNGDTDTFIRFLSDQLKIVAGGRNIIKMDEGTDPDKIVLGDSTTITYTEGKVGIGTDSPATTLDVTKTGAGIQDTMQLKNAQTLAAGVGSSLGFSDGTGARFAYIAGASEGTNNDNGYFTVFTRSSDSLSERLRIDSSGNVGIGITNPSDYFTNFNDLVVGSTSADSGITIVSSTTDDGTLAFADGTSGTAEYSGYIQYSHGTDELSVGTSGSEAMRIDSSGNVGIGTNNPAQTLEIHNSDASDYTDFGLKGTGHKYVIGVGNDSVATVNDKLYFYDNDNTAFRMVLDTSGSVGINNTSPSSSYKLDVNGAGHFVNDLILDEDLVVDDTLYVGNTTTASHKVYVEGGAGHDVVAKFKTTGTGTSDYSEIHIENNTTTDRTILGSIGSNYSNTDWSNSSYLYNTGTGRRFLIKSQAEMIFTTGGTSLTNNKRITIESAGQINMHEIVKLESVNEDTNTTTALFHSSGQTIVRRTLGSNAFNSDTIPTNNNQLTNGAGYITAVPSALSANSLNLNSFNNDEGTEYTWFDSNSSSAGSTWYKVARIVLGSGSYSGITLEVEYYYPSTNHGDNADVQRYFGFVRCTRSSGSDGNRDDAEVQFFDANRIRVAKTDLGDYELQARANVNNRSYGVTYRILSSAGATITPATTKVAGNTDASTVFYTGSSDDGVQYKFGGTVKVGSDLDVNGDLDVDGEGTFGGILKAEYSGEVWISALSTTNTQLNGFRAGSSDGSRQNILYRSRSTNLLTLRAGHDNGEIQFIAGGSLEERMRIDSDGNVGIGTDSPANTLHVYKNATIGPITSTTTSNAGLRIQDSGANMYLDGNSIILDNNGYLTTNGAYNFVIGTNNTPRIHVDADGNVGIGTDSPAAKLEIFGTGNTLRLDSAANQSKEILLRNVGSGTATIKTDGDLKLFAEDANKSIIFENNGGEAMRIDSSGNVGIGTAPSTFANYTNVSIKGGSSGSNLDFYNSSGTRVGAIVSNPSTNLILETNESTPLVFKTNENTAMTIDSSGNVGINNTSPSSFLSNGRELVLGDGSASHGMTIFSDSAGTGNLFFADGTTGDEAYRGFLRYTHSSDNMEFYTAGANLRMTIDSSGNVLVDKQSADDGATAGIEAQAGGAIYLAKNATNLVLNRLSTDGEIAQFKKDGTAVGSIATGGGSLDIYSSGGSSVGLRFAQAVIPMLNGAVNDGDVDLGTSTRHYKDLYLAGDANIGTDLDVGGASTFSDRLTVTDDTGGDGSWTGGILIENTSTTTGEPALAFKHAGTTGSGSNYWITGLNQQNRYAIAYGASFTDANTKLTLEASGDLGIGTVTPTGKFNSYISSARQLTHNGNGGDLSIISNNNSNPVMYIKGTGTADLLNVFDNTTEVFTILDGGNVGIGTNSPAAKLEVTGQIKAIGDDVGVVVSSADYIIGTIGAKSGAEPDKGQLTLRENGSSNVVINADGDSYFNGGNVGIGNTSPAHKLDLSDSSTTWAAKILNTNANGQGLLVRSDTTNDDSILGVYGNGSYRMIVKGDGNVGIGETSPTFPLDVVRSTNTGAFLTSGDAYQIGLRNSTTNTGAATSIAFGHETYDFTNFISSVRTGTGANPKGDLVFGGRPSDNAGFVERLRIRADGNVGIGTNSPDTLLHLSSASSPQLRIQDTTNNVKLSLYAQDANAFIGTNSSHNLNIGTVNTTAINISNSQDVTVNNDLDIGGTTTADDTITVAKNVAGTFQALILNNSRSSQDEVGNVSKLSFQHNSINAGEIRSVTTEDFTTSANRSADLSFHTIHNGTLSERLRINDDGNVGIGTNSPAEKLVVNTSNDGGAGGYIRVQNEVGGGGANVGINFATYSPEFYSTTSSDTTAQIRAVDTASYAGRLDIRLKGTGASGVFSNVASFNNDGNVGIGTTSPSYPLDILNNSTRFSFETSAGVARLLMDGANGDLSGGDYSSLTSDTSGNFFITTGNTERFRVEHGGNVGVGTDNPAARFEVSDGSSSITLQEYNNGAAIFLDGSNGDFVGGDYFHIIADGVGYLGLGGYGGGATPLNINFQGNVGIGTDSPAVPLHVQGADIATRSTTTATSVLRLTRDVTDSSFPSTKDSAVDFMLSRQQSVNNNLPYTRLDIRLAGGTDSSTPSLDVMSFLHNGNVGIGTTSPSHLLHVTGTAGSIANMVVNNDNVALRMSAYTNSHAEIRVETDHPLVFKTNGNNEKMRITSGGNVGIGTSSPQARLAIDIDTNAVGRFRDDVGEVGSGNFCLVAGNSANDTLKPLGFRAEDIRFATGSSERVRITDNGLTFNGDTAAANALDDYEEGTFTPTIHAGASNITAHSNNYGKYTKIGNVVHCSGRFQSTSLTAGSSSTNVELGGLPFSAVVSGLSNGTGCIAGSIGFASGFSGEAPTAMQIRNQEPNAFLYFQNEFLGFSNLKGNDLGSATTIVFQITYQTS